MGCSPAGQGWGGVRKGFPEKAADMPKTTNSSVGLERAQERTGRMQVVLMEMSLEKGGPD